MWSLSCSLNFHIFHLSHSKVSGGSFYPDCLFKKKRSSHSDPIFLNTLPSFPMFNFPSEFPVSILHTLGWISVDIGHSMYITKVYILHYITSKFPMLFPRSTLLMQKVLGVFTFHHFSSLFILFIPMYSLAPNAGMNSHHMSHPHPPPWRIKKHASARPPAAKTVSP